MKQRNVIGVLACCTLFSTMTAAGPYTAAKDKACPEAWSTTDESIPIIYSSTNPWGGSEDVTDDKAKVKAHIVARNPIETLDLDPVTDDDLFNDPLTIASECLVYRNFEVDTWNYVAPTTPTPNTATGWIPAAIL